MLRPFLFIQQVRAEAMKVTWPSQKETLITAAMVLLLVFLSSMFFLAVDSGLSFLIGLILGD
ncbi:MAG: preprotein translocase subunit SecE [Alphaproteobacteria bacterium]|nr:preprotein translocase subunit SecE [Alphaproteobacteria bacterium]